MSDKCPICGTEHDKGEPHEFFYKGESPQVQANYRWRKKNLKHWRTYQRRLMRKRRAEKNG